MNKTAIKNFAIWARNKLIADISYRAGLMGITADGIQKALPQSTGTTEFYDIGTAEPYAIFGDAVKQRRHLVELIRAKERETNYKTAYKYVLEEVAYTWFNRLIAVRFMEVNDYLPSHIRVLSSDSGKVEPDLVTTPFDAELSFTHDEERLVYQLKQENKIDEVFRILFIKQCNALNEILPALFEKTSDYTELLLNLSVIDQDGVVYRLVHDIPEEDFDVERGGQVEIIGWLYQFYNTEPKNEAFAKKGKITKEEVPAVTQLFTPDWIVRYMVENSVGRLWIEHLRALDESKDEATLASSFGWKYYLPEAAQEQDVEGELKELRKERISLTPEQITMIDPCMGSGHILVYAFDLLMQIYENAGYGQRDAAHSILENNLFGLDIDDRAYQMAYFAIMMKARQYNRRILNGETSCKVYSIQESNDITDVALSDMGSNLSSDERNIALKEAKALIAEFKDAKEYGSILNIEKRKWELLRRFAVPNAGLGQLSLDINGVESAANRLQGIIDIAEILTGKYLTTCTNPPYMGSSGMSNKLSNYVKSYYPDEKADLFSCFISKNLRFTEQNGFISMITMESWMFLSSFEQLRNRIISQTSIECLTHMPYLGKGGTSLGINFGTVMFSTRKTKLSSHKGNYNCVTYLDTDEDGVPLIFPVENNRKKVQMQDNFKLIPSAPIGYWLSEQSFSNFSNMGTIGQYISPRIGLITGDNTRFLRLWPEVSIDRIGIGIKNIEESIESNKKWFPYQKGGDYRKWYGNLDYVVDWENDGYLMKNDNYDNGRVRSHNYNGDYSFISCITWTSVTTGNFACRYAKEGSLFDAAGPICRVNNPKDTYLFLGILSSTVAKYYLSVINPTINFHPGYIMAIPFSISAIEGYREKIEALVGENIRICNVEYDAYERSMEFKRHPLCSYATKTLDEAFEKWKRETIYNKKKLWENETALNQIVIEAYKLQNEVSADIDEKLVSLRVADRIEDVKSLLSYAIGCMFGRYSLSSEGLSFAGGTWDTSKYSIFLPDADNVIPITDEEYLEDDIISRLCTWLKVVFGESTLETNLDFIASALSNKGGSSREIIRNYFLNDFFKDHCQTYSVTGSGKRPIYWLFDSGKQNGFKALIYLHRYNADTIGNLRIDYLHRMQRIYESEISRMQDMIDHSTSGREVAQATKRREKLTKQLKECREYDEKLAHLALSRIELDLDDGVKKNYRKIQTANDGKFYEVLADSKNIMAKE